MAMDFHRNDVNRSVRRSLRTVVIAVMGVTGAGKSSFIRTLTGNQSIAIGHGLTSETNEVREYKKKKKKERYVLVDTPGFDDTYQSNETITTQILIWLQRSFHSGARLNGIIYLHRITDPRMQGSSFKNLRMFRELCGETALENVVLATTFWDRVPAQLGAAREQELIRQHDFWGRMIAKGSSTVRLDCHYSQSRQIIERIANFSRFTLQVQDEMVCQGGNIHNTKVAQDAILNLRYEMDQKLSQDRRSIEVALERQKCEQETRIRLEKERLLAEANRQRRLLEAQRLREAEEAQRQKQMKHEREMQQLRERQKHAERDRILLGKAKTEFLASQKKSTKYLNHVCRRDAVNRKAYCDKCKQTLRNVSHLYYHCCFCGKKDEYDHCYSCGNTCLNSDHPQMKVMKAYEGNCIMM